METPEERQRRFDGVVEAMERACCDTDSIRICAVCLCDVRRGDYSEHMRDHGYETIAL